MGMAVPAVPVPCDVGCDVDDVDDVDDVVMALPLLRALARRIMNNG